MDSLDQILSILASLAGILGAVTAYQQHRVKNQPALPERDWRAGPPGVVRAAAVWVVVKASATVVVLYAVLATVAADLHSFSFPVPPLPDEVTILVPIGLAALLGVVSVPLAIQRAAGLRAGESAVRSKLLGAATTDLFVGVALAVAAQVFADDLPSGVFGVLTTYLVYSILAASTHLGLLLHRDSRAWAGARVDGPVGRR